MGRKARHQVEKKQRRLKLALLSAKERYTRVKDEQTRLEQEALAFSRTTMGKLADCVGYCFTTVSLTLTRSRPDGSLEVCKGEEDTTGRQCSNRHDCPRYKQLWIARDRTNNAYQLESRGDIPDDNKKAGSTKQDRHIP